MAFGYERGKNWILPRASSRHTAMKCIEATNACIGMRLSHRARNLSLAATFPHHKHVPPDIKHHRIPAPDISFTRPNLPVLLQEIEALISV